MLYVILIVTTKKIPKKYTQNRWNGNQVVYYKKFVFNIPTKKSVKDEMRDKKLLDIQETNRIMAEVSSYQWLL